jgi:alpha-mannosidase
MNVFRLSIAALLVTAAGPAFAEQGQLARPTPEQTDTFWFIPHTHWEGAVFKTREEYLEMGLQNILRAMALLKAQPNYRFTLDQACYVKPFLERYPGQEAALRKLISEGRLEIVGGTDVMADVNMPSGESFVRQVLYGKDYFRRKLGIEVAVGWQLDAFGHHAQMPQLLKLGGYKSFWFFRGVANWDVPSEFLWQGLDGSQIPAFWLPQGYAVLYGSPNKMPEFAGFIRERFKALNRQARGHDRVGPAGADVCEPEEHVPGLVEQFNRAAGAPFRLRLAVPTDFEKAVASRADRPVLQGELNPIFQGAYSSRIGLKQTQRDLERLLTTAEKLTAICQGLGSRADPGELWRAWEPVLFNQTHDLASGVMTDRVYEDTLASYGYSRRLVHEILGSGLETIASRIDTQGEGVPIVVWNTLGWPRDDVALAELGFTEKDVGDVTLADTI